MTFKKLRFLTFAFGLLLALFLSISFPNTALAEAAASPSAPPACAAHADPQLAVLENCSPSPGDTAWMLTSVALVLMMTLPGLGLFYGGMVRKKNVGDTVMTSFAIACLVSILW